MNKFHHAGAGVPLALAALFCLPIAPATAANITIVNSSCSSWSSLPDGQGNLTLTCETAPPVAGAPSCTSLSASTSSLPVGGGIVTLTANCTGAASYEWSPTSAGLTSPSTANAQSVTIGSTTTFSVVPIASDGARGNSYSRTVSVQTTTTPPSTGTVGSCSGFTATRLIDAAVPIGTANNNQYYSSKFGGWGAKDALVIRFTAPPANSSFAIAAVTASGASSSNHSYVLASEPCVFDAADPRAVSSAAITKTTFTVTMSSDGSTSKSLVPGKTYYLNASHKANGVWSCGASQCDMLFTVSP